MCSSTKCTGALHVQCNLNPQLKPQNRAPTLRRIGLSSDVRCALSTALIPTMMHYRVYSTHALFTDDCCLEHAQSTARCPCTVPCPLTALRHFSCAIHDPWKCVHENINQIKQQNCACYVGCCSSKFVSWITWLYRWYWHADVDVYLNNALKHQLYLFLMNFTP